MAGGQATETLEESGEGTSASVATGASGKGCAQVEGLFWGALVA